MIQGYLDGGRYKIIVRAKFSRFYNTIVKEWEAFTLSLFPDDLNAQAVRKEVTYTTSKKYVNQKKWLKKRKDLALLGEV